MACLPRPVQKLVTLPEDPVSASKDRGEKISDWGLGSMLVEDCVHAQTLVDLVQFEIVVLVTLLVNIIS